MQGSIENHDMVYGGKKLKCQINKDVNKLTSSNTFNDLIAEGNGKWTTFKSKNFDEFYKGSPD